MEIIPLGDSAVIVRVGEDFERHPAATTRAVLETQRRLEAAAIPGVIECTPGYDSVGVFFDPLQISDAGAPAGKVWEWLKQELEIALRKKSRPVRKFKQRAVIEIPVCYEGEFAPDLEAVARHTNLSLGEVIRRHSTAEYSVLCIGFLPGFAYLGGLPQELATPRRATPRMQVPAGAVGIGGAQTGIYPITSPGGWNLIGCTPFRLFDPERAQPAMLATGARVRFRAITRAEFDR